MEFEIHSDYGSGSSMDSATSWGSQDLFLTPERPAKAHSFFDLSRAPCSIEEAMQDFRNNGLDSPYDPDDDLWRRKKDRPVSAQYLRQKSWPAPESTPAAPLPPTPRPRSPPPTAPGWTPFGNQQPPATTPNQTTDVITAEQLRILSTLPPNIVYTLLRTLEDARKHELSGEQRRKKRQPEECRFCKCNGERELYYRSHSLHDARGLVRCPVLRAYVCARCGARGDYAHTAKYCPLATAEDRKNSANMMLSIRQTAGRYRNRYAAAPSTGGSQYRETPLTSRQDNTSAIYSRQRETPLDPLWAALEQKLSL